MQTQTTDGKTKTANTDPTNTSNETSRPNNNEQVNWDAWWNEYYQTHE